MVNSEVRETPEQTRFIKAADAYEALMDEIGALSENEITVQNAPFIAGFLLARSIEIHFLDTQAVRVGVDNPDNPHWRKMDMEDKRTTAKDHGILTEARNGNFLKLRDYVKGKAEDRKDAAGDYEEHDPENLRLLRIGRNLALLSERIPPTGDGSVIKVPNPAHIESPVPLRIQLGRFTTGEEIR